MENGTCVDEADTDSDDDFEYVSVIAMYRILGVLHVLQSLSATY